MGWSRVCGFGCHFGLGAILLCPCVSRKKKGKNDIVLLVCYTSDNLQLLYTLIYRFLFLNMDSYILSYVLLYVLFSVTELFQNLNMLPVAMYIFI